MILRVDILNWYENAPWGMGAQVEQDALKILTGHKDLFRKANEDAAWLHPAARRAYNVVVKIALSRYLCDRLYRYHLEIQDVSVL